MLSFLIQISLALACIDSVPSPLHVSDRRTQTGPPVPELNWQGISFELIYINASSSYFSEIQSNYIPLAISWYANAVQVVHQANITITATECAGIEVPVSSQNSTYTSDVVLLITYSADGETGAWAQPCEVDPDLGMRPIMGRVHFQGSFSNYTWEQMFALVIHEIAHILAYDARLLPYFQNQIGEFLGIDQILGYTTRRNDQIAYIKTPKVISKARSEFECNNLYGLDLEGSVYENSTSLHWEKRVMNNDFMVASSNIYYISYSDISLSFFEDSGWYQVDYAYSNTIEWGYLDGCDFLLDPCIEDGAYQSDEFCNVSSTISLCDYTHTFKGSCNLGLEDSPIPTQYQYFASPYYGGNDTFADYCPYVSPSQTGSCKDVSGFTTVIDQVSYGEMVCENCMCLEGTYVSQFSTLNVHYHAGCHQITCEGNVAVVHVGDQVVFCDPGGESVTIRGYDGYIICPNSNILCKALPCPFACHGKGICVNGHCQCQAGSYGTYCESLATLLLLSGIAFLLV